jgi:hypothetical protein
VRRGNDLLAGAAFASLLLFKHIFAYCAPLYFMCVRAQHCCCCRRRGLVQCPVTRMNGDESRVSITLFFGIMMITIVTSIIIVVIIFIIVVKPCSVCHAIVV